MTNILCANAFFEKLRNFILKYFVGQGVVNAEPSTYVYTAKHWLVIGLVAIATILTYFIFRKKSEKTKHTALVIVAWVLVICEIMTRVSKLFYFADLGTLDLVLAIKTILPIHFCQVMIWVIIFAIIFDYKPLLGFSALCGLIAGTVYLAYPIEGLSASFLHIRAFNSIFSHSLAFVASLNMLLLGVAKIDIKDMLKTYLILIAVVIYGFIMNLIFPGENYMFMIENPTGISTGPIPYQLVFAVIIATFIALFYLIPYWIKKAKVKKTIKTK